VTDIDDRTTITVHVSADFDLKVSEVFPDGAPEGWTIEDVKALMLQSGSPDALLSEWCLGSDLDVQVGVSRPNPAHTGGPTLPGVEAPKPWLNDYRIVWPAFMRKRDEERRAAT
jgi:hypothetical protein